MIGQGFLLAREVAFRELVAQHLIIRLPRATRQEIQATLADEQATASAAKDWARWEALDALEPLLWWGFPMFEGVEHVS